MASFGAKVKLTVDKTGNTSFNKEIKNAVKDVNIGKNLTVDAKSIGALMNKVQKEINAKDGIIVKVQKIDCSKAIDNVRAQLQTMLSALSVKNGVNIGGLLGVDGITGTMEKTKAATQGEIDKLNTMKQAASAATAQVGTLGTIMKSVKSSVVGASAAGKNSFIVDSAELSKVVQQYGELNQKIQSLNSMSSTDKDTRAKELTAEAIALQGTISAIQEKQNAERRAAAEAEKAAKKAKDAAEVEYATNKQIADLNSAIVRYEKANGAVFADKSTDTDRSFANRLTLLKDGLSADVISKDKFSDYSEAFSKLKLDALNAGLAGKTALGMIRGAVSKFGNWMGITRVVMLGIRAIKQMKTNVIELDTAMTELKKVTNETDLSYQKFLDGATVRAKALGATLVDTVNATADFARLGYSIEDASKLADAALVYKNVGDGIEDISTASESVISTMKAFGLEASGAMGIVDRFNEVGNKYAISSGGVGEALIRSSSALAAAGNTLDESIALATAANEIVQDPEKVGTSLKTLSMYLRSAKTEADDAGISTDGMVDSVSKLRGEILKLTGNRVDIQIDDENFKSSYQIMKELSAVWGDLTDISKANILEKIAGKRNANVVSAILTNFSTAENVLETSLDSAGSAMTENEKVIDSIEGRIAVFKATFEDLSNTVIGSDLVKTIVSSGTTIIEVLDKITEGAGGLPVAVTGLTSILAVLGKLKGVVDVNKDTGSIELSGFIRGAGQSDISSFNKYNRDYSAALQTSIEQTNVLSQEFASFKDGVAKSNPVLSEYFNTISKDGSASMKGLRDYCKQTGQELPVMESGFASVGKSIKAAAINIGAYVAISLAISLAAKGLSALINYYDNLREKSSEASQAAIESADSISEVLSSYEAVSSAVKNNTATQEDLIAAGNKVTDTLAEEGVYVRNLTGDYNGLTDAIIASANAKIATDVAKSVGENEKNKKAVVAQLKNSWTHAGVQDTADPYAAGSSQISFSGGAETKGYLEALNRAMQQAGYSDTGIDSLSGTIRLKNTSANATFAQLTENYEYLKTLYATASQQYGAANVITLGLEKKVSEFEAIYGTLLDEISATNETVAKESLRSAQKSMGSIPTTQEAYLKLREAFITSLKQDTQFDTSNGDSAEAVAAYILSQDSRYSGLEALVNAEATYSSTVSSLVAQITAVIGDNDLGSTSYRLLGYSAEELQAIADAVANGARGWGDIYEVVRKYNSETEVANRKAASIKDTISTVWSSEDFADSKKELVELANSEEGISAEKIIELAAESEELSLVLEQSGVDAQLLAKLFENLSTGVGLEDLTGEALLLNDALNSMKDELLGVTEAKSKYDAAMDVKEKNEDFKGYAEAYKTFQEQVSAGTVNSNAFWASAEFLLGADKIESLAYDSEKIAAAISGLSGVFSNEDSSGTGLIQMMYEMSKDGHLFDKAGNEIAEIKKLSDGSYDFNIDSGNLDAVAEKLGITRDALVACLEGLEMFGDINFTNMDGLMESLSRLNITCEQLGSITVVNSRALNDYLKNTLGKTPREIYQIEEAMKSLGNVEFVDVEGSIGDMMDLLKKLDIAVESDDGTRVTSPKLSGFLSSLHLSDEQTKDFIKRLSELDGVKFVNLNGEIVGVKETIEDAASAASKTSKNYDSSVNNDKTFFGWNSTMAGDTEGVTAAPDSVASAWETAQGKVDEYDNKLDSLNGKTISTVITTKVKYDFSGAGGGTKAAESGNSVVKHTFGARAGGTSGAKKGKSLVGEEGAELVQSGDHAYLVGTSGPEIVHLEDGDRVFTAKQTEQILKKSYGSRVWGNIYAYADGVSNKNDGVAKGNIKIPASVSSAAKAATTSNSSLEESLKNQLDKYKEALDGILQDFEHSIFLLEEHGASAKQIVAVYQKMQDAVHAQAEKYRSMGLSENSDYIQDLQKQWYEYKEKIEEAHTSEYNEYLKDKKFAIEQLTYDRADVSMVLGQWRSMLRSISDEIEYWRGQGKKDTDDVIQDLYSELHDAESEIDSVLDNIVSEASDAVDSMQDVYSTLKDAAGEYAESGFVSIDTLQSIIGLGTEYLAYLQDENGQLVINEGSIQKMLAAKTEQLAVDSALNYVEQIKTALAANDALSLNQLLFATTAATNSTWGLVYANLALLKLDGKQYSAALANINRLRAISVNTIANIGVSMDNTSQKMSEYYDEASDAMEDLLDMTMDLVKQEAENKVDALNNQIDKYKEIIDLKKEVLDLDKDEADYNDEVAEKIKEIANLQAKIDRVSLDDSREAKSQRLALEDELAEKQKDLAEYQAEYGLEKQKDALDKEGESFDAQKQKEIEAVERTVSSEEKVYQLAIDRINNHFDTLYGDLISNNTEYGNRLNSEIVETWNAASDAMLKYGSNYETVIAALNAGKSSIANGSYTTIGTLGEDYALSNDEAITAIVNQMKANSTSHHVSTRAEKTKLHQDNMAYMGVINELLSGTGKAVTYNEKDYNYYIDENGQKRKLYDVYHSGGVVGHNPTVKQDEVMSLLQKREIVLDDEKQSTLFKMIDMAKSISSRVGSIIRGSGAPALSRTPNQHMSGLDNISQNNNSIQFSPKIEVSVSAGGDMTMTEAKKIGEEISNVTMENLYSAFAKKGLGGNWNSVLKP